MSVISATIAKQVAGSKGAAHPSANSNVGGVARYRRRGGLGARSRGALASVEMPVPTLAMHGSSHAVWGTWTLAN